MEKFDRIIELILNPDGNAPIHNCMLLVKYGPNQMNYLGAVGKYNAGGDIISPDSLFRTGSMTKPFMATIILQLIEEGLFGIEDLFLDLLPTDVRKDLSKLYLFNGIDYTKEITIVQLLGHRSGIPDYFADDERFLKHIMDNPTASWNWTQVIEKYFELGLNKNGSFKPGNGYHYSDTNYLLLGALAEHVTGNKLYQIFNERIISPLALKNTYLEYFPTKRGQMPMAYPYFGSTSLENINTSFDWGGGGLISTLEDLDIFIRALIQGKLFRHQETLMTMLNFIKIASENTSSKRTSSYGLGIMRKEMPGYSLAGHSSAYASMMYFDSAKDMSIILSLNQGKAILKAEWLMQKILNTIQA